MPLGCAESEASRGLTGSLMAIVFLFFFHKFAQSISTDPAYCISSNNSRGRLFLFSHQKGAIVRGKAIIRGRRLFQIFRSKGGDYSREAINRVTAIICSLLSDYQKYNIK